MRKLHILGLLIPFLLVGNMCYAGYDEAVAAYKRGEYMLALKEFFSFFTNKDLNSEYIQWKQKVELMGLPKNYDDVIPWLERQANQGSAEAQYYLGIMYRDGLGVLKNPELARQWLKKAADQGFDAAQYDLGIMYFDGNTIPKDYNSALKLLQQSAHNGNGNAMIYMGKMYSEGLGVSPDIIIAYAWLTLAEGYVGQGEGKQVLQQSRKTLAGQMSSQQIEAAETMINALKQNVSGLGH